MGFLTVEQVNSLSSAHGDLLAASDLSPDAPFAAQAVYLAARTLDYGFLQDFVRAMELYRWCFVFYPGTPEAMRSRERYEDLKSKFEGIEGTGHGE